MLGEKELPKVDSSFDGDDDDDDDERSVCVVLPVGVDDNESMSMTSMERFDDGMVSSIINCKVDPL